MVCLLKEFHITDIRNLPEGDAIRLDFRWAIEKGEIKDFAINVSLLDGEKSVDIFRVDTKHGYLHEQRFWLSSTPKPLERDYNTAFVEKKREVFENYVKWARLFKESKERGEA